MRALVAVIAVVKNDLNSFFGSLPELPSMKIDHGTSVRLIRNSLAREFLSNGRSVFFPGAPVPGLLRAGSAILDVVLLGDALDSLLRLRDWPEAPRYRLWCLSTAYQRVLKAVCELEASRATVKLARAPDLRCGPTLEDSPVTLWYAGRISPDKDLDLLLKLAHSIQNEHPAPVLVKLIGSWDTLSTQFLEFRPCQDFRSKIELLVSQLDWKSPPHFLDALAPEHWTELLRPEDIFVSTSRYWMEDFGVAARQAADRGCRLLLSDWGGHQDVIGKGWLIPSPLLDDLARMESSPHLIDLDTLPRLDSSCRWARHAPTERGPLPAYSFDALQSASNRLLERFSSDPMRLLAHWKSCMESPKERQDHALDS